MPSFTATIMFYTPNYDAAVKFAQALQHELLIMTGWIILYWVPTKGLKPSLTSLNTVSLSQV